MKAFEKGIVVQIVKRFPAFMERKGLHGAA
jgi:hypothetical protein